MEPDTATADQLARITALCAKMGFGADRAEGHLQQHWSLDTPLAEMRRDAAEAMIVALTTKGEGEGQARLAEET